MFNKLKPALRFQLSHLLLSSVWNIVGVVLIAKGMPALGPTASLITVALMLLFAALMIFGARSLPWLYALISIIVLVGAFTTIISAFHKPPSLWPSDFWRYAGVGLNSLGIAGAMLGLSTYITNRAYLSNKQSIKE